MSSPPRPWRLRLWIALLGAWIALVVAMSFVATSNLRATTPERLRHAAEVFAPIADPTARRMAVRYVAAELNRGAFAVYDRVNVALLALALALLLGLGGRRRALAILLALVAGIVAVQLLWLTPTITELGRSLDFVPREPPSDAVRQFGGWHGAAVLAELAKLLLLGTALVLSIRRPG